ncbi:CDP-alcohol phosphatidyltransferase family protein [Roseicyclus persicicus]|uniref:CDP-alcohol phosphatidyltransferase family protein n=1 Tax=Roseicyclus persicicus TaxID=2650661 RepID=A0A7X6GVP7_9RHOB|nr:CDP-alcohol phosphatidyltransferase family protein [Roseibacterium persicicum]NKX43266.1 CDP-alcohol phosphatidyltransferase family protein [Roseibacterium persicicum]
MIDAALLPLQRRLLAPPGQWLAARGVRADQLTVAGCLVGLGAAGAAALGMYGLALLGLALNRLADGLDGAVARVTGPTDRGAFLDIALDFVFYAAFPLGFVLADPGANAVAGAVLVASFVLSGTSFLAFAAVAAKRGMSAADYPQKGIFYLGGLTEGAETIAVFAAFCVFPGAFAEIALVFAAACAVTGITRFAAGWRAFSG